MVTEKQNAEKATINQSPQKPVKHDFEKSYMTMKPRIDTSHMIDQSDLNNNIEDRGNFRYEFHSIENRIFYLITLNTVINMQLSFC